MNLEVRGVWEVGGSVAGVEVGAGVESGGVGGWGGRGGVGAGSKIHSNYIIGYLYTAPGLCKYMQYSEF